VGDSKSTDKRFVGADRSAAQRVASPEIVTDYLTTMAIRSTALPSEPGIDLHPAKISV
jgi:hypothetical protein